MIQNHIHLSDALGGSPEFAPTYTWSVRADGRWRVDTPNLNLRWTLGSHLSVHVPMVDGVPYIPTNWRYVLRVGHPDDEDGETKRALLRSFVGKRLYLCDNFHAADGANHTDDIQRVRISSFEPFHNPEDPMQRWYWWQVDLVDATRDLDP